MSTQQTNYDQLIEKLDAFTRKYYINQLIRGSLYTVAIVIGCFIAAALLESFFFK
jgi:hypothetical protein